jgi:hypothetical protein
MPRFAPTGSAAEPLGLDARFVDEAVARAGGNVQHAVTLQRQLKVLPAEQRRVEDIPRGLAALIERSWERIASDAVVVDGLGILCAAREVLTLDELGAVAGWTGAAPGRIFLRSAKELLVETLRPDGQSEYRLHHDSIRGHIAKALGPVALRGHHAALARRLATWPDPGQVVARQYALHHALMHRAEAGDRPRCRVGRHRRPRPGPRQRLGTATIAWSGDANRPENVAGSSLMLPGTWLTLRLALCHVKTWQGRSPCGTYRAVVGWQR